MKLDRTLFAVALTLTAPALAAQDLLVRASRIVVAPDTLLTDSALLVRAGKIAYVGGDIPAEARGNAKVVDYGDATIAPGFVLATSTLGRDDDLAETAVAFTPDLRADEAFDPWLERLGTLAHSGVTSVGWSPSPRNVAGGIAALVKPGAERGRVAAPELFVALSLANEARTAERPPTSLMGAKELLRDALQRANQGVEIGPDLAVLRQVLNGSRRAFLRANTFAELSAALELAAQFHFTPVLCGARDADKVMARLVQSGAGVVLDELRPDDRLAALELPRRLAEAGVPFAFGGSPEQLRFSAVLAVRHGLDRKTALAALTRTPATLLAQPSDVGALRQGNAADFVVFRGDLLDLAATHVATWVDGVRLFATAVPPGAQPAAQPAARPTTPPTTAAAGER